MELRSFLRTILSLGRGVTKGLSEESAGDDPIALFGEWFAAANRVVGILPEAMAVATASRDGIPSARMMLLKSFDEGGFVFYTNYESRKGRELAVNPRAALLFWWPVLQRQVRVEGQAEKLRQEESAAYFATRPRGSRLGAWASKQSSVLESRRQLEEQFRRHEERFRRQEVPLPAFWGGFRLRPERIEFWQGRLNRLHDRLLYIRRDDGWERVRLSP